MLSGHSRLEAFHRLGEPEIPAKFFKGTESEAINYAKVEANRGATKETILEDIKAYKLNRDGNSYLPALTKADLKKRWGKEANKLEALSFLNPGGMFLKTLNNPTTAGEAPYLELRAIWTGQLRKDYPKMTNAHEDEIFRWLYIDGSDGYKLGKDQFQMEIESKVSNMFFDPNQALGLNKEIVTGLYARPDTAEPMKRLNDTIRNIKRIQSTLEKSDLTTEAAKALRQEIGMLMKEKERLESEIDTIQKTQGSLFGVKKYQFPEMLKELLIAALRGHKALVLRQRMFRKTLHQQLDKLQEIIKENYKLSKTAYTQAKREYFNQQIQNILPEFDDYFDVTPDTMINSRGFSYSSNKSGRALATEAAGNWYASKAAKLSKIPEEFLDYAFRTDEWHHHGRKSRYYEFDEVRYYSVSKIQEIMQTEAGKFALQLWKNMKREEEKIKKMVENEYIGNSDTQIESEDTFILSKY